MAPPRRGKLPKAVTTRSTRTVRLIWHRLSLYNGDHAYVEASSNLGMTWSEVKRYTIGDSTSTWSMQQFSLAGYVGEQVMLRFRLWDDDDGAPYVADGWYLDDVEIAEAI